MSDPTTITRQTEGAPSPLAYPTDIATLAEYAVSARVPLSTLRTWSHRHADFPPPWRPGRHGEPHLYLLADLDGWRKRTGRLV